MGLRLYDRIDRADEIGEFQNQGESPFEGSSLSLVGSLGMKNLAIEGLGDWEVEELIGWEVE